MSPSSSESESEPSALDRAIADYLEAVDAQQPIDREEFLSRYPLVRDELAQFIDDEQNAQDWVTPPALPLHLLEQTVEYRSDGSASTASSTRAHEPLRGKLGQYQLLTFLGEGGMGRVYEAVDPTGQHVALKVLNQQWSQNPESMQRFKLEGALAGTINHPRCVFVRAVDEFNGQPFIVMELMSGKTLRDLVTTTGPLSAAEAVSKILDVIDGLKEAHDRGVIHRDIKPANCFLEPTGRVKLGDFGLARSLQQESELTQTGSFIGTPLFASPEQVRGEPLDYRTDIYSVCATLYYLLTGQAPFGQYSSTQVIARIVSDDPVPIRQYNSALPKLLEQVVQRGLSRNRDRRFQDLDELRHALEPFVSGRQAIAQLARRLGAYGFDTCFIAIFSFALSAVLGTQLLDPTSHSLWAVAVYHALVWVYLILFEGLWSATPGKFALQLRVVDSRTGERPGWASIVLRTAIYLSISTELPSLLQIPLSDRLSVETQVLIHLIASLLGLAALAIPLRSKQGSRLLHDVLSNTLVVASHHATTPVRLLPTEPVRELTTTSAKGWPARLGSFEIRGVIWQSEQQALLSGTDSRLNRNVWLHVDRDPNARPYRSQCQVRPSRLRYLAGGEEAEAVWTAYVAPTGAPLRYWVTPQQRLTWREARLILEQLVDELRQSRNDGGPLHLTSLDQLWLDSQGRVLITDWPLSPPHLDQATVLDSSAPMQLSVSESSQVADSLNRSERAFAAEAMRMSLTGKSRPLDAPPSPIAAPLPLHARGLLEELVDTNDAQSGPSLTALQTKLHESTLRPWLVTRGVRLWMMGISILTLMGLAGAMVTLPRVGNQVAVSRFQDAWLETCALQRTLENPDWLRQWQLSNSQNSGDATVAPSLDSVINYRESLRQAVLERWKSTGAVQREVLAGEVLDQMIQTTSDRTEELKFERATSDEFALTLVDGPVNLRSLVVTAATLARRSQMIEDGQVEEVLKARWKLFAVAQTPILGLILWSALARGGVPFLLLGIYIVKLNGNRASRWLIGWRSLLTWFPLLILNNFVVAIDLYAPEMGWLATMLHLSMLGVLLANVAIALRWPECGPQDWLAGTRLVPA